MTVGKSFLRDERRRMLLEQDAVAATTSIKYSRARGSSKPSQHRTGSQCVRAALSPYQEEQLKKPSDGGDNGRD
jgi:hypothetical protein